MALPRSLLQSMNLSEEQIETITAANSQSVSGLTKKIEELENKLEEAEKQAKKADKLQKELDELKTANDGKENPFEKQYNDLKAEYNKYKADVAAEEKSRNDKADYRKILLKAGVPEDKADTALKLADLTKIKRDKDGNIENEKELVEGSKEEWKAIIPTVTTQGAQTATPPANNGGAPGNGISRAAQLAAKYHENLYGKAKE